MADWIHCNDCYKQPGDGGGFLLTNCGHIYCKDCIQKCTNETCKMCNSKYMAIQLTNQLKPEVQLFFTDAIALKNRLEKDLREMGQALKFQAGHRQRYAVYTQQKLAAFGAKFESMKKCLETLSGENKKLEEENRLLKKMLQQGEQRKSNMINHNTTPGVSVSPKGNVQWAFPGSLPTAASPFTPMARAMSNSSPSISSSVQEHGMNTSQGGIENKSSQKNFVCPNRVSVRTPPIDGRMGIIASQSPTNTNQAGTTPTNYQQHMANSSGRFDRNCHRLSSQLSQAGYSTSQKRISPREPAAVSGHPVNRRHISPQSANSMNARLSPYGPGGNTHSATQSTGSGCCRSQAQVPRSQIAAKLYRNF